MEYIELTGVTAMPLLCPIEKGDEKWYEVVFWGCTEFTPNEEPRMLFRAIVREEWLKTIGEHFLKCIDRMKEIKFKFRDYQYKDFGVEKKPSADNLRYMG